MELYATQSYVEYTFHFNRMCVNTFSNGKLSKGFLKIYNKKMSIRVSIFLRNWWKILQNSENSKCFVEIISNWQMN